MDHHPHNCPPPTQGYIVSPQRRLPESHIPDFIEVVKMFMGSFTFQTVLIVKIKILCTGNPELKPFNGSSIGKLILRSQALLTKL